MPKHAFVRSMDPEGYLSFSAVDLVTKSHRQADPFPKQTRSDSFSVFFSKKSRVNQYVANKRKTGNCSIFFNGKIVLGPRWDGFLLSLSIYVLIWVTLTMKTTIPFLREGKHFVLLGIMNTTAFLGFILLLLTSLTNPGIIPRNESGLVHPPETDPKCIDSITGFLVPRFLLINGVCVRQKFCRTCMIYRPPRSNHCSVCDNCVLKHDHHCVALGTCVGLGNYRWFLLLCSSMCLLFPVAFWLVQAQLRDIYNEHEWPNIEDFLTQNVALLIVLVLSLLGLLAFALLFIYHYFITIHNLTTNEHLKKYYKVNPFDYGRWVNIKHALCFPQNLLPTADRLDVQASYRELASTNSECVSDFYDY
jgi:palmitoyltransferase ZDHHC9/14/18